MNAAASGRCRILIVERDRQIRTLLATLLQFHGYESEEAATLEEALERVDGYLYDFVLTDLFGTTTQPRLEAVKHLQQRCHPTPVGILTGWQINQDEVERAGFAFALQKPFDLDVVLHRIAGYLNAAFTPEQQQQAQVIRRYLQALSTGDWGTLRSLCTEDVGYSALTKSAFTSEREIKGIEAYLAYARMVRRRLPDVQLEHVIIFQHPKGLIARYATSFTAPNGTPQYLAGSLICRFRGERLSLIGFAQNTQRLRAVLTPSPQYPPQQ